MPYSSLDNAVPLEERLRLPNNEPAAGPNQDLVAAPVDPSVANRPALDRPAPNPPNYPQDQVPDGPEPIDPLLVEIPQKEYDKGLFQNDMPAQYIPFGPSGFVVAKVLAGDRSEVVHPDNDIPTIEGRTWPMKTAFHFAFEDTTYGAPLQLSQQNVRMKRGGFARRAAEEIMKMLEQRPQFPFTSSQLKVVGIYVRSRGTVQARLCVWAVDWHTYLAKSQAAIDTSP